MSEHNFKLTKVKFFDLNKNSQHFNNSPNESNHPLLHKNSKINYQPQYQEKHYSGYVNKIYRPLSEENAIQKYKIENTV